MPCVRGFGQALPAEVGVVVELLGGFVFAGFADVGVDVAGDGDAGVAHEFLGVFFVDACFEQDGGEAMAQLVGGYQGDDFGVAVVVFVGDDVFAIGADGFAVGVPSVAVVGICKHGFASEKVVFGGAMGKLFG